MLLNVMPPSTPAAEAEPTVARSSAQAPPASCDHVLIRPMKVSFDKNEAVRPFEAV
jgi:hypothetical protein